MHRAALPQLQLAAPMLPTGRRPVHHAYKATRMARREATARLAWSRGPTLRPCPHGRPASLAQYGHGSSDALHCPGGSTRPPSVSTPAATPAASPWLRLAGVRPACGPALRLAVPLPAGPKQRRVNDNLGAIPQPVHALDGKPPVPPGSGPAQSHGLGGVSVVRGRLRSNGHARCGGRGSLGACRARTSHQPSSCCSSIGCPAVAPLSQPFGGLGGTGRSLAGSRLSVSGRRESSSKSESYRTSSLAATLSTSAEYHECSYPSFSPATSTAMPKPNLCGASTPGGGRGAAPDAVTLRFLGCGASEPPSEPHSALEPSSAASVPLPASASAAARASASTCNRAASSAAATSSANVAAAFSFAVSYAFAYAIFAACDESGRGKSGGEERRE
eukprot:scaffold676_cov115-Isochrysis_galbana.AAC.1